jgi:hypothetical protein
MTNNTLAERQRSGKQLSGDLSVCRHLFTFFNQTAYGICCWFSSGARLYFQLNVKLLENKFRPKWIRPTLIPFQTHWHLAPLLLHFFCQKAEMEGYNPKTGSFRGTLILSLAMLFQAWLDAFQFLQPMKNHQTE